MTNEERMRERERGKQNKHPCYQIIQQTEEYGKVCNKDYIYNSFKREDEITSKNCKDVCQ